MLIPEIIKENVVIGNVTGNYGKYAPYLLFSSNSGLGSKRSILNTLNKSDGTYNSDIKTPQNFTISVPNGAYKLFAKRDESVNNECVIKANNVQLNLVKGTNEFGSIEFIVSNGSLKIEIASGLPYFFMVFNE